MRMSPIMTVDLPVIINRKQLALIVPFSSQHVLRLEKMGKFPKRIKIGERRVGWRLSEIEAWLVERMRVTTNAA